jgi:hypothetical protein
MKGDLERLLDTPEPPALGPGPRPGVQTISSLQQHLKSIFATSHLSAERQQLVLALTLLWHDHLDASHEIAQGIDNPDGSFIHGIMHRREPDYSNAKYWFRRVHQHGAFPEIAARVNAVPHIPMVKQLVRNGNWDAFAFIDCCEEAFRNRDDVAVKQLRQVQRIETEALLGWLCL